jgi:CAAX protease family protein
VGARAATGRGEGAREARSRAPQGVALNESPAATSVVARHPLIAFFALAYALSWGSFILLSGPTLFAFGPFTAAVVVASASRGRAGVRELLARCLRWRVGLGWCAAALLVPAAIAAATVAILATTGAPMPATGSWQTVVALFPGAMVDAPLWEESGWRGFALPRFSSDRSRLANTLILGLLLAGWHLPIALRGGAIATPYLIAAVGSTVVTNWVYYGGGGSALLAILYHTAANTAGIFCASISSGPSAAAYFWSLAAVNGAAATLVVLGGALSGAVQRVDHP